MARSITVESSLSMDTPANMDTYDECTLLSLAPELRNRIYEYVLILDCPGKPDDCTTVPIKRITAVNGAKPSVLSVLQTCRQICDEAQGVFYAQRLHFQFADLVRLPSNHFCGFLHTACKARLRVLQQITVRVRNAEQITTTFRYLDACTNLEVVNFDLDAHNIWIPGFGDTFSAECWFLKRYLPTLLALRKTAFLYSTLSATGELLSIGYMAILEAAEQKLQDMVKASRKRSSRSETEDLREALVTGHQTN